MSFYWDMSSGSVSIFSALRGSTADTCLCQSSETLGKITFFLREGGHRILQSLCSPRGSLEEYRELDPRVDLLR